MTALPAAGTRNATAIRLPLPLLLLRRPRLLLLLTTYDSCVCVCVCFRPGDSTMKKKTCIQYIFVAAIQSQRFAKPRGSIAISVESSGSENVL